MKNTSRKGYLKEYGLKKRLENLGWTVERKLHTPFHPGDFFGVADMFGFHVKRERIILIACTSLAHKSKDIKRLTDFAAPPQLEKLVFCYTGDRWEPWRVFRVYNDSNVIEVIAFNEELSP